MIISIRQALFLILMLQSPNKLMHTVSKLGRRTKWVTNQYNTSNLENFWLFSTDIKYRQTSNVDTNTLRHNTSILGLCFNCFSGMIALKSKPTLSES